MSRIIINGKSFNVEGSLSMINGKWYDGTGREIDMNNLEGMKDAKTINITIEGNVDRLDVDHCNSIVVNGDCKKVKTTSGDIRCNDIDGDAESVSGDIECEVVHGDAKTVSGNIRSSEIRGKASTTTGKVNGEKASRKSSSGSSFNFGNCFDNFNDIFGSAFGNSSTVITNNTGEVISGGFSMTKDASGKKYMNLSRNCTVNGRRIGDMSDAELKAWIAEKAKQGKIINIID